MFNNSSIVSSIEFDKDQEFFAIAGVTKRIKIYDYNVVLKVGSVMTVMSRHIGHVTSYCSCHVGHVSHDHEYDWQACLSGASLRQEQNVL